MNRTLWKKCAPLSPHSYPRRPRRIHMSRNNCRKGDPGAEIRRKFDLHWSTTAQNQAEVGHFLVKLGPIRPKLGNKCTISAHTRRCWPSVIVACRCLARCGQVLARFGQTLASSARLKPNLAEIGPQLGSQGQLDNSSANLLDNSGARRFRLWWCSGTSGAQLVRNFRVTEFPLPYPSSTRPPTSQRHTRSSSVPSSSSGMVPASVKTLIVVCAASLLMICSLMREGVWTKRRKARQQACEHREQEATLRFSAQRDVDPGDPNDVLA